MLIKKIKTLFTGSERDQRQKIQDWSPDSPPQFLSQTIGRLAAAGGTDRGRVRERNEDAFWFDVDTGLFLLADGMGGHRAGDVAARLTISKALEYLKVSPGSDLPTSASAAGSFFGDTDPEFLLVNAIHSVNLAVHQAADDKADRRKMGATFIAAIIAGDTFTMAHVGDVRGYHFTGDRLNRITLDHTAVAALLEGGRLTPEQARNSPYRHRVERAIGPHPKVEADINRVTLTKGDRLLLCSDGLWDMVQDQEIEAILKGTATAEKSCAKLIKAALSAGGEDNVTVVVIDVTAALVDEH